MNTHADQINWTGKGAKDHGVAASQRDFQACAGGYVFTLCEAGISFHVDRLRRKWDELHGEIAVRCDLPGASTTGPRNTISVANLNISNIRARHELAIRLAKASRAATVGWDGLVEELCQRLLAAERAGQPAVHLCDLERPAADDELDIDGFRLPRRHPAITFGDGGALKSYFAVYVCGRLVCSGLRVLFCDWEFSGEDHRDRLERLFGAQMPDLLYVRCDKPLVDEADRLRRIVRDEHVDYIALDSIAFACDGPPEAAEVASAYLRALRSLGVGSLNIAHISRSEGANQKPFGSAFWHNGARMTWFVERANESPDSQQVTIGLFNRKTNIGPVRPAVGFEFTFDEARTYVRRADVAGVPDLASKLPLWQRMKSVLARGPMTLPAMAEELEGSNVESIERAVRRGKDKLFTKVKGSDGVTRVALLDRRSA